MMAKGRERLASAEQVLFMPTTSITHSSVLTLSKVWYGTWTNPETRDTTLVRYMVGRLAFYSK